MTLPLIRDGELVGYDIDDLKRELSDREFAHLSDWLDGQTLGLTDDGRSIVFQWDFDRWRRRSAGGTTNG